MPRKKKDEVEETVVEAADAGAVDATAVEATPADGDASTSEASPAEAGAASADEADAPAKKTRKSNSEAETAGTTGILDSVLGTAAGALETVAVAVGKGAANIAAVVGGGSTEDLPTGKVHKRAEKVGIVASDKMTKTVTVRVDRLVKHPVYRKYVRKRKKFMAHDDLGAKIGDKVKIVETRPLSARKRWRVVEILQKAEL